MDARHFDRLTRALNEAGTRRGLLGLLATLPVLGGLLALLNHDETDAKGRRKRRKKAHKHGKGRHKGKHKKPKCKPHSRTKTCQGTCGAVKNNCKKTVDCGTCDCDPPCDDCFTCQSEVGQPASCVPEAGGAPCGEATCEAGAVTPQGSCDGSGACLPGTPVSCDPYTQCDGNACATTCADNEECVDGAFCNGEGQCVGDKPNGDTCDHHGQCASGFCVDDVCCNNACAGACEACNINGSIGACTSLPDGDACGSGGICCSGSCETGVCCADAGCASVDAPDCVDHACVCAANSDEPCDTGETCCDDGCVDLQTNHDHCGACNTACAAGKDCCAGDCVNLQHNRQHCGSCDNSCEGDEICVDGACGACDVTCTGTPAECGAALQAAINAPGPDATVYVCPGAYRGGFEIANSVTVIGAGQGDDETANTILHGNNTERVLFMPDAFQTVGLQRLRITGGRADEELGGAGILNVAKLLVLTACTVSDNHTNLSSPSRVRGAISNGGFSRLEMTGCTVSANSVTNGDINGQALGAGIYSSAPSLVLSDCVIRNNTATGPRNNGAGIFSSNIAQLTNCRITENTLTTPNGALSGGIAVDGILGSVTLTDSFVWDNTAPDCTGVVNGGGCGVAPPA